LVVVGSVSNHLGGPVTVTVTIENRGMGKANGQFKTKWWPDSKSGTTAPPQCVWEINSLAAHHSVTQTCLYVYPPNPGTLTTHAFVDYDHNITEADENNNTATYTVHVN
jgi:subtilase family serine protease